MGSSLSCSARPAVRNWIQSVEIGITCCPSDRVPSRSVRLEVSPAMSQKFRLKIVARSALLLLAGFGGVSAVEAQAIEQKVTVCRACHVPATLQSTSVIPNIWGQSEGYLYLQLRDFKSGTRNAPEDAAMRGFVATMSDADMLEMAKYASTQPWPKVEPVSTDTALLKKGAYATALGGCVVCHFNDWKGFSANPRIADQTTPYPPLPFPHSPTLARPHSPA